MAPKPNKLLGLDRILFQGELASGAGIPKVERFVSPVTVPFSVPSGRCCIVEVVVVVVTVGIEVVYVVTFASFGWSTTGADGGSWGGERLVLPAGAVSLNGFVDHWDYSFHCRYLSNEDSLLANDFFLFNLKDKRCILLSCFKTLKGFFFWCLVGGYFSNALCF